MPRPPSSRPSRSRRPVSPWSCAPTTRTGCCPTVRSRCARLRLGPVGVRDIEAILGEHGVADPPAAARLARLAAGRPGTAIAYARAPEAVRIRGELARTLLDLLGAGTGGPARRDARGHPAGDDDGGRARRRHGGGPGIGRRSPPTGRPDGRASAGRRRREQPSRPLRPSLPTSPRTRRVTRRSSRPSPRPRPSPAGRSPHPPAGARPRSSSRSGSTSRATWPWPGPAALRSVRDPDLIEELTAAAADAARWRRRGLAGRDGASRDPAREQRVAGAGARRPGARLAAPPPGRVTAEPARVELVVRGSVQGVGFRYFAWREAMALDLEGWVANERDGSVRCVVAGSARPHRGVHRGPPGRSAGRARDRRQRALGPAGRRSRALRGAQRVPPGRLRPSDHRRTRTGRVGYSLPRPPERNVTDDGAELSRRRAACPLSRHPRSSRRARAGRFPSGGGTRARRRDTDLLACLGSARTARPRGPAPAGRPAAVRRDGPRGDDLGPGAPHRESGHLLIPVRP